MFTIAAEGTREGIKKLVKAANAGGEASSKTCQKQIEAAKTFIVSEVDLIPAEFNAVRVDATGHFGNQVRQLQVTIIPRKLVI